MGFLIIEKKRLQQQNISLEMSKKPTGTQQVSIL